MSVAAESLKFFPLRQRTGTASWHLSKKAVDLSLDDLERFTERRAMLYMAEQRWGSSSEMPCPHCGTIDKHYWSKEQLRWKCKACGKRFSATSGTVFAGHKLPLVKMLKIAHTWASGSSGVPGTQLRRYWNVAYGTILAFGGKLREACERGFNTGVLCGINEMDGMDINGRRYRQKRNQPARREGQPIIPAEFQKDAELGSKEAKKANQPHDRRLVLVIRQRGAGGRGGVRTRVAIAVTESSRTVLSMVKHAASAESAFMTDEDKSYATFKRLFARHETVCHSKGEYSKPGGISNNMAESFNARHRRASEGVYLNVSTKYLQDYAAEQAWREDVRRLPTGKKLAHLFMTALSVGMSWWWRGYSHGVHRENELLVEGDRPAKARGKRTGWKDKPPR